MSLINSNEFKDIDVNDHDNVQMASDLVQDIMNYYREKEIKDKIDFNYLNKHPELNSSQRYLIVNWIVKICNKLKIKNDTLYLSILILDRYLSMTENISCVELQLVAVTSLFIATKYEDTFPESLANILFACNMSSDVITDILDLECLLLTTINWNLTYPSHLFFLRRYSKAASFDSRLHTLCKYIIELILLEYSMLLFENSLIAASCVFTVRRLTFIKPFWSATLVFYTNYKEDTLTICTRNIIKIIKKEAFIYLRNVSNVSTVTKCYLKNDSFHVAKVLLSRVAKVFDK